MQKDKYELELENELKNLKNCENYKNLKSCYNCEKIFDCDIRKKYVDAVYNSMSKGSSGGFDF